MPIHPPPASSSIGPLPPDRAAGRTLPLLQGEQQVSSDPGTVITTVLGSCIAACLWDPRAGIGGMNHFLLPDGPDGGAIPMRYGLHAMELLINALLRQGADRATLRAKLFGGAHLQPHLPDIGSRNIAFAQDFLNREGILCIGGSTGGNRARRIRFWPHDGRAQQFLLPPTALRERPSPPGGAGEVLLF